MQKSVNINVKLTRTHSVPGWSFGPFVMNLNIWRLLRPFRNIYDHLGPFVDNLGPFKIFWDQLGTFGTS